jgi:hypothetical protein
MEFPHNQQRGEDRLRVPDGVARIGEDEQQWEVRSKPKRKPWCIHLCFCVHTRWAKERQDRLDDILYSVYAEYFYLFDRRCLDWPTMNQFEMV